MSGVFRKKMIKTDQRRINRPPRSRQLVVPKWQIIRELESVGYRFADDLIYCISYGTDDPNYKIRLLSASTRLFYLSRLVYKSKGEFCKLSKQSYSRELFKESFEIEEVEYVANNAARKNSADTVLKCIQSIEPLTIKWVSCVNEQMYMHEFAFLIDYVIRRNGDVPEPDGLFPKNYKDFNYWEGIGEEFNRYSF